MNINSLSKPAIALAAFALAYEPARWLLRTWTSPAYASEGEWVFVVVACLLVWSGTSAGDRGSDRGWKLLIGSAAIRALGNLMAISVVGALTLTVDIYAIGRILRLEQRKRPIAPEFLAVAFAFALPLERIAQRLVGFGLQQVSAQGACALLKTTSDQVICQGTHLIWEGTPVLVDLPCSGARGLLQVLFLFAVLASIHRPNWKQATGGFFLALVAAVVSNMVRITALAVGIAKADVIGIDVMAQPWHDVIGLLALALAATPLLIWARFIQPRNAPVEVQSRPPSGLWLVAAAIAVPVALITPSHPMDVSRPVDAPELPTSLVGVLRSDIELSELESDYFTKFGGGVAKAHYGNRTLLVVRTTSPLRHLHAPDECLRGAGYEVERLGIHYGTLPGASYRATDPAGRNFVVTTTYISDQGHLATSVSEAVFVWMKRPDTEWTAVERIVPERTSRHESEQFDAAIQAALELHPQSFALSRVPGTLKPLNTNNSQLP